MKKYFLLTLILMVFVCSFSQTEIEYKDKIYDKNIKTVLFYRSGWEFSYPILELNSGKQLILEFDDLNDYTTDYYYTIIHCNSDWTPSNLNPIEYIKGFEEEKIQNYESSFNTLVQYTHYQLMIPNNIMEPVISGNYLLLVYTDYDKSNPVLSRRFFVVDNQVTTDANIHRSSLVSSINDSQELEINIHDEKGIIYNPQDHLRLIVCQNNDQNNCIELTKPDFIKGNIYQYLNPRKMIFKGGNEYRYFNVKSTKYVTDRIYSIRFNQPYYIFEIIREKADAYLPYTFAQDINGEMLIVADHIDDCELEADYVYVDFTLDYKYELTYGSFYVYGAVSGWEINDQNKMAYDSGNKAYNLRLLVKQGFYNYQYVFVENDSEYIDLSLTEGNHYETENNYVIYVYYTPQGSQYDELIGYTVLNSMKRL